MAEGNASSSAPFSQTALSTEDFLGNSAQAIIAVNQKLKQLGIDQTISLPQLCVIGDQSAGKSSLIEAVSNIQVPKSDGTCTRCPVAINLASGPSADSPWTCKVSIEERYDYIAGRPVTEVDPLGPWNKRVDMKTIELETIYEKSRVPALITKAQNYVLEMSHGHSASTSRVGTRSKSSSTVKFSPNVIRLDITEGIRPNLCFIDLPGVISNVVLREDFYLIELIANLVKEYAKDPRNENILTLPMTADVQTSRACSIVQELQVEERTLAVFTKPDRVNEDQQNQFISLYLTKSAGTEHDEVSRFESGCHFVMLANSNAANQSGSDAESDFFKQPTWSSLDEAYRHRLGVPALCDHLRDQLFHKTYKALPENLQAIEAELASIEQSLQELPQPPNKVFFRMEMLQILEAFAKSMDAKFLGDSEKTVKGALRAKFERFKASIMNVGPAIDHATEDEIELMEEKIADIDELLKEKKSNKEQDISDNGKAVKTKGKHFTLMDLRRINKSFFHSGLPGDVDPRAITKASKEAVECWHDKLGVFLRDVHKFFETCTLQVFAEVFKKYQNLEVYPMVKAWIETYIKEVMLSEQRIGDTISLAERSMPFTMNNEDLEELNMTTEQDYLARRLSFRIELAKKEKDVEENVYRENRKDVNKESLGRDDFKSEIILGSKVAAYYQIASKRFVDTICQGVHSRMLPICGEELAATLKDHIGTRDSKNEDQITQWLIEDPEKENLRTRLANKRQQLLEGRRYIESVLGNTATTTTATVSPSKRSSSPGSNIAVPPETPAKKLKVSPSKTSSSPASNVTHLPETRAKKPKVAHRPGNTNPVTPRSQLTKDLDDFEMVT